jgi:hypothetical protein
MYRLVLSIAATSLVVMASEARAQSAEAEALFNEGDALMKQGKTAEACDAFDGSNRLEPRAGTLIRLGECREKNEQLAWAWSAYKDALNRAKDPTKKNIASAKVRELESRLSYVTVTVPAPSRVEGLVIERSGASVDPALWNHAIPTNGGEYTFVARAPGKQEWTSTTKVPTEKGKITITVPTLQDAAKGTAPANVMPPSEQPDVPPGEEPGKASPRSTFTTKRKVAVVIAGVAALGVVGGVVLGTQAKAKQNEAYDLCPTPEAPCADFIRANALIDTARSRALGANVAFGVGGALAIGAAILWFTGAPKADASLAIVPAPSGVTVMGSF